jgi:hypothetical protein
MYVNSIVVFYSGAASSGDSLTKCKRAVLDCEREFADCCKARSDSIRELIRGGVQAPNPARA